MLDPHCCVSLPKRAQLLSRRLSTNRRVFRIGVQVRLLSQRQRHCFGYDVPAHHATTLLRLRRHQPMYPPTHQPTHPPVHPRCPPLARMSAGACALAARPAWTNTVPRTCCRRTVVSFTPTSMAPATAWLCCAPGGLLATVHRVLNARRLFLTFLVRL